MTPQNLARTQQGLIDQEVLSTILKARHDISKTKCKKGMHLILVKIPEEKKIYIFQRSTDILKDKRSFVL